LVKQPFSNDTGEKPYQCRVCSAQFVTLNFLRRHMRSHPEDRSPFGCAQCDDATFTLMSDLKRHSRQKHNGVVLLEKPKEKEMRQEDNDDREEGEEEEEDNEPIESVTTTYALIDGKAYRVDTESDGGNATGVDGGSSGSVEIIKLNDADAIELQQNSDGEETGYTLVNLVSSDSREQIVIQGGDESCAAAVAQDGEQTRVVQLASNVLEASSLHAASKDSVSAAEFSGQTVLLLRIPSDGDIVDQREDEDS
jgi:hypothetical protein